MTTWVNGDTITTTWMNSVEKVLALGTFGATTSPRLTLSPNSTYDLAGNVVATNLTLSGTATVLTGKQYEALGFRTLTSAVSGTGLSTAINILHSATVTDASSYAYMLIGQTEGVAGAGKVAGGYFRTVHGGAAFTGTMNAVEIAATCVTGSVPTSNTELAAFYYDTSDLTVSMPIGIGFQSNTAAAKISNIMAVLSSVDVTITVLLWNMRAGSTGSFLNQNNSAGFSLFAVDYLGNLKWGTTDHLISMDATTVMGFKNNLDITLGKAASAHGDTAGHVYIQAHATAPDGVPTGYAGFVPVRYCTTDKKIYIYDGGWIKTAALS